MKKLLLFISILLQLNVWCQNYSTSYLISSTDITLINLSIRYEYNSSKSYIPYSPYESYGNILSTLQGRFDYNWKILSQEYGKLNDLKLVNKSNQAWVDKVRPEIAAYIDAYSGNANLARSDVFYSWLNYVTQVVNNSDVKNELLLLQEINSTIAKLKRDFPYDFYKQPRYIELGKALEELRNCSKSEISNISWKYGLL